MTTGTLDGTLWRLLDSRAWDADGQPLPAPYGPVPLGQITFLNGRMLAALCRGDAGTAPDGREYSSYGGPYAFDGRMLEVRVDAASDPARIGGVQRREVMLEGTRMVLRPPPRLYGASLQRRELTWACVWRADGTGLGARP